MSENDHECDSAFLRRLFEGLKKLGLVDGSIEQPVIEEPLVVSKRMRAARQQLLEHLGDAAKVTPEEEHKILSEWREIPSEWREGPMGTEMLYGESAEAPRAQGLVILDEPNIRMDRNAFYRLVNAAKRSAVIDRVEDEKGSPSEGAYKIGFAHGRRLRRSVARNFRSKMSQPNRDTPGIPDEKIARLALELIVEETGEALEAFLAHQADVVMLGVREGAVFHIRGMIRRLVQLVREAPLAVDLVKLADAFADIDFVVEQARAAFGIDGVPIEDIVAAANMSKASGPVNQETGKRLKPPNFVPPEAVIEASLRKQGMR